MPLRLSAIILLVLPSGALSQTEALRLDVKAGETLHYLVDREVLKNSNLPPPERGSDSSRAQIDYLLKVTKMDKDRSLAVDLEIAQIRFSNEWKTGNYLVNYDTKEEKVLRKRPDGPTESEETQNTSPAMKYLCAFLEKKISFKVDAKGAVSALSGFPRVKPESLKLKLSEKDRSTMLQIDALLNEKILVRDLESVFGGGLVGQRLEDGVEYKVGKPNEKVTGSSAFFEHLYPVEFVYAKSRKSKSKDPCFVFKIKGIYPKDPTNPYQTRLEGEASYLKSKGILERMAYACSLFSKPGEERPSGGHEVEIRRLQD